MPATIKRSAQNSNVFRAYGIMSSHKTTFLAGPGIPDPRLGDVRVKPCGHRLPVGHQVVATPILGGLHHEYSLQRLAA